MVGDLQNAPLKFKKLIEKFDDENLALCLLSQKQLGVIIIHHGRRHDVVILFTD